LGDAKRQKAFTDWLGERGIKYEIVRSRGKDYVVWDGPENLAKEYLERLGSECSQAVARADEKTRPCG
jgi:hypothetical protein